MKTGYVSSHSQKQQNMSIETSGEKATEEKLHGRVTGFEFCASLYLPPALQNIAFFSSFLFCLIRMATTKSINSAIIEGIGGDLKVQQKDPKSARHG